VRRNKDVQKLRYLMVSLRAKRSNLLGNNRYSVGREIASSALVSSQ
jgi:hypothetical protein